MSGDWVSARPFFQQCALDYQNLGMAPEARMATMMKGITTAVGTNEARDLNQVHAALVDFRERNDRFGIGLTVTALGEAARLQGEYPLAKVYFDEALACMRDSDNIFWIGALLQNLAQINLHASDWRVAVTLLSEMLELASECEDPLKEAYYFATMGHVAILRDNYIVAANLFGAASNVLRNLGVSFEPADQAAFERNIRAGKAMLGSKAFTVYFDEGTQWDRTQALFISASLRD